ncbi:CDP-alcohol phosphatidyltransferase family protein [Rickettsiella massiliensis]|uniref:CDP-alcohol phosphatidyltransferase family protein n=1 Tax=Rickettsiella massiliensis TaxID=676517 RepID=UPI00029B2C24|nr:CDP-alcohol phosphatidyltransferase family protein [Rickettsiella massiliensis]
MIQLQLRYLPNLVTCIRFILIGPILWALLKKYYPLAFYLFLVAGLSDGLDGFLARFFGWTSQFGALIDPLADKLLLMSSFMVLAYLKQIPFWLMILVIGRDTWIMGGALIYRYCVGPLNYKPVWISKLNTFLQLVLVTLLLIKLAFYPLPERLIDRLIEAVFITSLLSFIQYTWVWARQALFYSKILKKEPPRSLP